MAVSSHSKITYIGSAVILVVWFVFLLIMAFVVRHTEFVTRHTGTFIIETLVLSALTAAPIFVLIYTRDAKKKRIFRDFVLVYIKVLVFWILGEFSGLTAQVVKVKPE